MIVRFLKSIQIEMIKKNRKHGWEKYLWTKKDEAYLLFHWGHKNREEIAKELNRTIFACEKRMKKLTGSHAITRGRWTQAQLAKETGFGHDHIRRAVNETKLQERQPPKERLDKEAEEKFKEVIEKYLSTSRAEASLAQ